MRVADFLRLFTIRAPNLMWFLGAGASAAAGVPTAQHMIWEFKRLLYCTENKIRIEYCQDLGDPLVRARLQQYFDSTGRFPPDGSVEEYGHYFEAAYPAEADRRRYIEQLASAAVPSYGHLVLAALAKLDKTRIIWTVNFDRVVDAAIVPLVGIERLTVATLDAPDVALQALNEERWPLLVKLHGDFQSRRLKNIAEELRAQDARLRRTLVESCRRNGLAVVGYSGRDQSIIEALREAIDEGNGYPFGLFWFHRHESSCLGDVGDLVHQASSKGIEAHIIEIETFDELMADVIRVVPDLPEEVKNYLDAKAPRVSDAPIPDVRGGWPVIRLNALPVVSWPTMCRRVVCDIGGTGEVRSAVQTAGADILALRRKLGVIAFGSDAEIRRVFEPYKIADFDLHSIEARRLRYESAELALLYEALFKALQRERPVRVQDVRSHRLIVDLARIDDPLLGKLREAAGEICGLIPRTSIDWAEAARVRLDYRLNHLWVLIVPTVWAGPPSSELEADWERRREFLRERRAARFNRQWNALLDGWIHVFTARNREVELRAFGIGDGVDAVFRIGETTAFSHRGIS